MSTRATENVLAYAQDNGLAVVFPKDNELQLDLDSKSAVKEFERRLSFFKSIHPGLVQRVTFTKSRSGGTHVYIELSRPVQDKTERMLLQAILGSDPKRETLSLKDLYEAQREPTLFFEKLIPASQSLPPLERFVKRVRKAWNSGQRRKPGQGVSPSRPVRSVGY